MTIVYINNSITNSGGMERILADKANYLVSHGHEVHIISLMDSDQEPFFYFDQRIVQHSLSMSSREIKGEKHLSTFLERVDSILKEIKADVAISMGLGLSRYTYLLNDGSKKILETHFSRFKRKNRMAKFAQTTLGKRIIPLLYRKEERLVAQFDRFVVLTKEDALQWPNAKNIEVIQNMVDVESNIMPAYEAKKIIGVGRYTGQKSWHYMIEIWAKIAHKYPNWSVSIYGNGHKKSQLQRLINKHGLQNSFFLNDSTDQIKEKMLESSILVLTSKYEGLPLVLLEAMSLGLPCISFDCLCGPRDIIADGENGCLVRRFDRNSFAEKLSMLIENITLRQKLGENAKDSSAQFRSENIMPKWVQLFSELIIVGK